MYLISAPCTYVQDGRVVFHLKAGAVVELSDDLAAELGDKVRRVGGDPDASSEAPEPVVPLGSPAVVVEPEPVVDETVEPEPVVDETVEPEPEETVDVEEAPTPRGRRSRGSDG